MVGLMTLTGSVVVDHQHHAAHDVFPIIGAHVLGMYALVLVVGDVVDRIGRTPALSGGLVVMAVSSISLLWVQSVPATAVTLFGLGLGWNLSFVAATAQLADCTAAWERGRLLGFNDLLSGLTGASLALLGGARSVGDRGRGAGPRRGRARARAGGVDPAPRTGPRRAGAGCRRLSSAAREWRRRHPAGQRLAVRRRHPAAGRVVGSVRAMHDRSPTRVRRAC